jgi:lysyl-tRNA synthetase class 2
MTHCIEPRLGEGLVFVYDYPASQAALAKVVIDCEGAPVARRFEAYVNGMELANGYWELTDAEEQARRFDNDFAARRRMGLPEGPLDEKLMAALRSGLPECAGIALGVDRLMMQMGGEKKIGEVLTFPFDRL